MKSTIKFSYNKISLFCVTVAVLFIARIVHAHFIEDDNVKEGEVIDKELEAFKSLINGLETIKADDVDDFDENNNDNNDSNNDDKILIGNILNGIVNSNSNNEESSKNNTNDSTEEQKSNNDKTNSGSQDNENKVENKEKEIPQNNDNVESKDDKAEDKETELQDSGDKVENKDTENQQNDNKIESKEKEEQQNNDKVEDKDKEGKENDVQEDKNSEKENKDKELNGLNSEENKSVESSNEKNNSEEKPKKVQLVTEHQIYKEGKHNSNGQNNSEFQVNDKESDEDIKSLVKVIISSEGNTGEEAAQKENEMFQKVKEAIDNNIIKAHNSELDNKAKEEELNKNLNISKPEGKHAEVNDNNNVPEGVFKVEESFVYKCFFDQECTNFKGFTPDVASCNKTSRRCSNYCFVQKACLTDTDCSTSCGSWCLKEDDMVFGRCVMSFDEGDFCMESWRVCNDGLACNINTYVCEKPRIPITFTRIDSQESLLSIIIFLLVAIYLIKNSRSHNFVSFFSGYNLNEYCSNATQEYDPLPEYQRTEVLNPDEMDDLIAPPPDTDAPSNVEEAAAYCGYIDENNNNTINCNYIPLQYDERPVPYDPYDEPIIPYDVPPSGDPSIEDLPQANDTPSVNENGDINVRIPSLSSLSDTNLVEPPPDYDETIFHNQ